MSLGKVALIIGAGPGISYSFAKLLKDHGYKVAMASRDLSKLNPLASSIGATSFACDVSNNEDIVNLFTIVENYYGTSPEVVLYNASSGFNISGNCGNIDYSLVSVALQISAVGAFVAAQEAGKRMILNNRGAVFFTGATAGIKGYAKRGVFNMGKFALRGLAQSLYKELSPMDIHVCHFVIDGGVVDKTGDATVDDVSFSADDIAQSYMAILAQPKGA